jgi:tetratricopeptide (TPR) repeat protein
MAAKKKCFVISPIGDDNSEIRKEADALLWVAKSALEKFNFEVIRVDQIARSTVITNEIIQLIQEAELCLIVLTGHNPNVFYEAGRRHEGGRPFIQLMRKGEQLPFDVASIRTILYEDIQSLSSAAKVVGQIQNFVEEYEKSGYGTSGTGVSMSTIAASLDRIERKVGQLMSGALSTPMNTNTGSDSDDFNPLNFLKNPRETFIAAIAQGDIRRAASLLPRLEQIMGPSAELVVSAGILASQGYEPAMEVVYRLMVEYFEKVREEDIDAIQAGISSIVQYYIVTGDSFAGINRCSSLIEKAVNLPEISNRFKAALLNQLQMLYYGAKQYQSALSIIEQVLDLNPDESAFVYNASVIYQQLGLTQKQLEAVEAYMRMSDIQPSHLSHAVKTYLIAERIDDARNAFLQLRQISPDGAAVLLFQSEIASKLAIKR